MMYAKLLKFYLNVPFADNNLLLMSKIWTIYTLTDEKTILFVGRQLGTH